MIAAARSKEIFTAASLLTVLGLSMALGAFLAGVLLAESEYRHEMEADIEPFKGLLLGLFFVAVGMSVDYGLLLSKPLLILTLLVGMMGIKWIVVFVLARLLGCSSSVARNMAFLLPQGGEFAFVLFGVAVASNLLSNEISSLLVIVVSLPMALTPLLVSLDQRRQARCPPRRAQEFDHIPDEENAVILAGFGRVGQVVGRILRVQNIGFTALEHDSEQVNVVRRFGQKIYYGDASRLDLLEAAGARRAKLFVLAIDDVESSLKTADTVREHFPNLKIIARARNRQHAFELLDREVTVIHREHQARSGTAQSGSSRGRRR